MKVSADPFLKVKKLIQELIERLLSEAAAEATKKGFCDNELSKARKDRDFRFAEVKKLSSDIRSFNAKKEELETELEQLAQALKDLDANLAEATKIRGEEKEENLQTMKDARQGLTALTQAIQILKIFYKQAAKADIGAKQTKTELNTEDLSTTEMNLEKSMKSLQ